MFFLLLFSISFWFEQIYNYAYITWTDTLVFEWQVWEAYADVKINYNKYLYNNKHCFEIIWTWLTWRFWPVYFNWYVCNDWSWTWKAFLEAWWEIDLANIFFNDKLSWEVFYASWFWYSFWIWLWDRKFVKIYNHPWEYIFDFLTWYIQVWTWIADWIQKIPYSVSFYALWKPAFVKLDYISSCDEYFSIFPSSYKWYQNTWNVVSLKPWLQKICIKYKYLRKEKIFKWLVYFLYPFEIKLRWTWDIWTDVNVYFDYNYDFEDLIFSWVYESDYNYKFQKWGILKSNWILNIIPENKVDEFLNVSYIVKWKYILSWKEINFEYKTNSISLKANKTLDSIKIVWNCFDIPADWKSKCILKAIFYNIYWYLIPWYTINKVEYVDINKNFDLDEFDNVYSSWLFLDFDKKTDNEWKINIYLVSYKPVINANLNFLINNYKYYFKNLSFAKAVDIYFSWLKLTEWVSIWDNKIITLVYNNLKSNIYSWNFYLSWKIIWCNDCSFLKWWILTWNNFWKYNYEILLTWNNDPDYISYYDLYYSYYVDWDYWKKYVKLKPSILINWKLLNIYSYIFWIWLIWLWNKSYINLDNIIWSDTAFSHYINDIRREININFRWYKKLNYIPNLLDNFKWYYDCNGNSIKINGLNYKWDNVLLFKNCPIYIKWDIKKIENGAKLKIISLSDSYIDYKQNNWWQLKSNIYVSENVSEIHANIITDWTIFCTLWDEVFIINRYSNDSLRKQLFIKWKIISRNTIWGWFWDNVIMPWWFKVPSQLRWIFDLDIKAEDISQAYDLLFCRSPYSLNRNYDTNIISNYVKEKFWCVWDLLLDNKYCYLPIVLEYDN